MSYVCSATHSLSLAYHPSKPGLNAKWMITFASRKKASIGVPTLLCNLRWALPVIVFQPTCFAAPKK
ncbi:hypothetical protein ARMGADRAFT_77500 [Armillaria gallica]|uniref:Uncharacterized protein n=1 Tax=Armillaria gallica TaxID=47427 RepID=A0A2H3CGF3_ARMGA|nr:hypothetical protein ARMGADRAFT_77500 [Armillaria gallica]